MSNIERIVSDVRNKEKGEHYFNSSYSCSTSLLDKMVKENLPLPDVSFFKTHTMKGENYLGEAFEMNSKFKKVLEKFIP